MEKFHYAKCFYDVWGVPSSYSARVTHNVTNLHRVRHPPRSWLTSNLLKSCFTQHPAMWGWWEARRHRGFITPEKINKTPLVKEIERIRLLRNLIIRAICNFGRKFMVIKTFKFNDAIIIFNLYWTDWAAWARQQCRVTARG